MASISPRYEHTFRRAGNGSGWRHAAAAVALLLLGACVTINVYFPAAAAEQAADRFIDGVWGDDVTPPLAPPSDEPQSRAPAGAVRVVAVALDLLVPAAAAQQANIDINTPAAAALQDKMRTRHGKLVKFYAAGAVGLTADGMIAVRDANAVSLKDRRALNGLVKAENADRAALYAEVARANGHPEWQQQIQATFARRWIERAEAGWYYRSSNGWSQR